MDSNESHDAFNLKYPKHRFSPHDLLSFIETPEFSDDWERLGFDVVDDLHALQIMLMANPRCGTDVVGTGGLRQMMFVRIASESNPALPAGYVCYVYFEEFGIVLLVSASRMLAELNLAQREEVRALIDEQEKEFSRGPVRFRNDR